LSRKKKQFESLLGTEASTLNIEPNPKSWEGVAAPKDERR